MSDAETRWNEARLEPGDHDCLSGSYWCPYNGATGRDIEVCGPCREREDTHDGRHVLCDECRKEDAR